MRTRRPGRQATHGRRPGGNLRRGAGTRSTDVYVDDDAGRQDAIVLRGGRDFRLDPEFSTRRRILDFGGGGILVIGIHAHVADFEAGLAVAEPVVQTFRSEP